MSDHFALFWQLSASYVVHKTKFITDKCLALANGEYFNEVSAFIVGTMWLTATISLIALGFFLWTTYGNNG